MRVIRLGVRLPLLLFVAAAAVAVAAVNVVAGEVVVVQAYTTAWRGSGTVETALPQNVQDEVTKKTGSNG